MTQKTVRAVGFDLWDTLIIDNSDEPKRAAASLPTKVVERRQIIYEAVSRHQSIPRKMVDRVCDAVDAAAHKVWTELCVTWPVAERIDLVLQGLGQTLPEAERDGVIACYENMELAYRPDVIDGVPELLKTLHGRYRLAIISDAIFSPGHALRQILADAGLLGYFDALIFSDEAGRSKPDPAVFLQACKALEVTPAELVYVGDREANDIRGSQGVGARAILTTVSRDRGSDTTAADAICRRYAELPQLIDTLAAR